MSIRAFVPELWSSQLLVALRKAAVFNQPGVVNRDYEAEVAASGNIVRITSIGRPTIGDYVANTTTVTPEELTDAQRNLTIDHFKYFAFKIDDVDAAQAKGNVMGQAMSEASYGLRDTVDSAIAGLYTQVQSTNAVASGVAVPVTTAAPGDMYSKVLIPLAQKLNEANVPAEGRWVVIAPWMLARLQADINFVNASKSASTELFYNGQVGHQVLGFNILVSNNVPLVTGDDYQIMAGVPSAISFAEQIREVEAYRPQATFGDALKGLHAWGVKVIRPDSLATALVSQT